MTPAPTRFATLVAAVAMIVTAAGGCTSFFPLDPVDGGDAADGSDASETIVPGDVGGDLAADADAPDVPASDVDVPDGAADADIAPDPGGDSDGADGDTDLPDDIAAPDADTDDSDAADATDATDGDIDAGPDAPLCVDPCPQLNDTRCAKLPAGSPVTLEVCGDPKGDGCLQWVIGAPCPKDLCQGPATCSAGVCGFDTTKTVTCPPSGNPCTDVVCAPATGLCEFAPLGEGTACDDKDPCTTFTNCDAAGKCVGPFDPVACDCTFDVDCAPKEDGNACNGKLICQDHACVVNPTTIVTCPPPANPCRQNLCNESTGACTTSNVPDDTGCDDGDACTLTDVCTTGNCIGTEPVICDLGPCVAATCAPATGECSGPNIVNCCGNFVVEAGELCDDGNDIVSDGCEPSCQPSTCVKQSLNFQAGGMVVPGAALLSVHNDSTFDFWAFVPFGSVGGTLFRRPNAPGGDDLDWRVTAVPSGDGVALSWIESKAGGGEAVADGPLLSAGTWHHVAVVRAPTAATPAVSWYLDGGPSTVTELGGMQDLGSTADLWIGSRVGGVEPLDGLLDDLRISDFARFAGPFAPPLSAVNDDPQTVAIYHFDDVRAGVAVDATTHKHHAAWQGASAAPADAFDGTAAAPRCDVAYCARGAATFTGSPAGGMADMTAGFDEAQSMTIEFFIRPGTNPAAVFVMGRDEGTPGMPDWRIELRPATAGKYQAVWVEGRSGGLDFEQAAVATVAEGVWTHLTVIRDYFSAELVSVRWFVGGKAETPKLISSPLTLATTEPLRVGSGPLPAPAPFVGTIDELRISDAVLFGSNFVVPAAVNVAASTIALFRFDAGAGGYAYSDAGPLIGPLVMPVVTWDAQGATQLSPCPP
jgi:cysteine-rich repeat protein